MTRTIFAALARALTKVRTPIGWLDEKILAAAAWCLKRAKD